MDIARLARRGGHGKDCQDGQVGQVGHTGQIEKNCQTGTRTPQMCPVSTREKTEEAEVPAGALPSGRDFHISEAIRTGTQQGLGARTTRRMVGRLVSKY